jgi:hypothetical protein
VINALEMEVTGHGFRGFVCVEYLECSLNSIKTLQEDAEGAATTQRMEGCLAILAAAKKFCYPKWNETLKEQVALRT